MTCDGCKKDVGKTLQWEGHPDKLCEECFCAARPRDRWDKPSCAHACNKEEETARATSELRQLAQTWEFELPPPGDVKFLMHPDGRWSVDKDTKRQQTIVTLRLPFTEGVSEGERGVRKLISERLGEIGDVLMNLWRKGKEKTGGSQDSGEDG